jgi:DNA-binding CsgD family transcriptional regulator
MESDLFAKPSSFHAPKQQVGHRLGVIVVSLSGQLLFLNDDAQQLAREFGSDEDRPVTVQPTEWEILKLCDDIRVQLQSRTELADGTQLRLTRLSHDRRHSIHLQAVLVPGRHPVKDSVILILLEEDSPRRDTAEIRARFGLTDREMQVIQFVMMGATNKEIAAALSIAEQTVKEHLKHIMDKTDAANRTALLARLVLPL